MAQITAHYSVILYRPLGRPVASELTAPGHLTLHAAVNLVRERHGHLIRVRHYSPEQAGTAPVLIRSLGPKT